MFEGCVGDPVVGLASLSIGTPGLAKVRDYEAGTWLLGSYHGRKTLPQPCLLFSPLTTLPPPDMGLPERPEGCLLVVCAHTCVGLQVLTCVCQCTWQERGGKIASEGCSRCRHGLQGCTQSHPVTFGGWATVHHSPNPGPCKWLLFLATHAPCPR